MKRIMILAAVAAVAVPAATAFARPATSTTKLQLHKTAVGTILVDAHGLTLYAFTRDSRGKDSCAAISGCLGVWPLVTPGAKPIVGPGVKASLVGTITLKNGARQVTYAGHPLYTYVSDRPGQTSYVNVSQFGGRWPALNAAGQLVK